MSRDERIAAVLVVIGVAIAFLFLAIHEHAATAAAKSTPAAAGVALLCQGGLRWAAIPADHGVAAATIRVPQQDSLCATGGRQ